MDKTYSQLARLIAAFVIMAILLLSGQGFADLETVLHFGLSILSIIFTIWLALRFMNQQFFKGQSSPEKLPPRKDSH